MDTHRDGKKTILFIDDGNGRTGATVSMEYLVKGFNSRGYSVYVLTSKTDSNFRMLLENSATLLDARKWGLKTIALDLHFTRTISPFSPSGMLMILKNSVKFFLGIVIVWKAIGVSRADIVYANEYAVIQGSLAAFLRRIPSVMHIRSRFLRGTIGIRRAILARLIPVFNDAVFAITKIEADQLQPSEKGREKIRVIGEFFPMSAAQTIEGKVVRKAFGFPEGKQIVTMLGGILEIKGTIDFLRAAERVARERKDVLFVLAGKSDWKVGDGGREYFEECSVIIEVLRQLKAIIVLGEITNSLELVAASEIVVSPSRETHFARPVIEAWGFSKPVIAVRTEHIENLISDNVNGLLVTEGSSDNFAMAIQRLLQDGELCRRLGSEGKKRTRADFSADENVGKIVDICDSLVNVYQ